QERLARPDDPDQRALARLAGIAEGDTRAGALQQRLGDEQAEAEAAAASTRPASRHIGFADAVENLRRKTRPVVDDRQLDLRLVPCPAQDHGFAGEIDGVLDEVA